MSTNDLVLLDVFTELEVRSVSERTVGGIIVPWDSPTLVDRGSAYEVFRRGALTQTINMAQGALPLYVKHDPSAIVGKMVAHRDDAAGQFAEFRFVKTPRADEHLELAAEGIMDGFSLGFYPIAARTKVERHDGKPLHVRSEVRLDHVGLLRSSQAAYADAKVLAVREANDEERAAAVARAEARKHRRALLVG